MPSTRSDGRSRRHALAGLGTAIIGSLGGCSGRLGPERLDAEATVEDGELRWQYPPRDGDRDGLGDAGVAVDGRRRRASLPPALRLTLDSTVGGIAASEQYRDYRLDRVRFRLWPPTTYEATLHHSVRVAPPGQWEAFSTYYDLRGDVRRTTVELRNVETGGTVEIPAVFDPGTAPLPDRLHCSFTLQASGPGLLEKTVRVTGRATLPLAG
ncbi:hypothetical protein DU500_03135 [Haloplanus rubicundus]|uniref:Uncharacterized protein n=1 Tax=Haloplanus rubicundus TaxID=1547898 RepID=A0A345DZZ0_9EURY|nr:hypothetical protein [Haloplanus rubicundus]AXG05512.1 hypothetical protein DU500_03135 [Haloplanus rubicundus]